MDDFVLASLNPVPVVFGYYPTLEEAARRAAEINPNEAQPYTAMSLTTYLIGERRFYLSEPLTEIDAETFKERLEILPPMAWRRGSGLETFILAEPVSSPYHQQYARLGDRYATRMVDITDRATWISADELLALTPGHAGQVEQRRVAGAGRQL